MGDSYTVCVAAEIAEHLLGAAEGWLGVHHPIAVFHGVQVIVEEAGIAPVFDRAGEL